MIRIHVLLLASLLSIWGLTSCENSDTDKVNSYNLEVNLSQNEITAINGIISIKVSIKEFDQLAYLVINKINDTNNISEKYIKSNLSPEYIFEYIIKKDDSSTFYFEFIAVDNNNQSSEISKLIVNKGIVNYSRELKFSNLKCVSRITGAEINGTNGLPIVEFEVNNRTNELYNVGGTDLGIVWELQPGHYGLFFGDTFGSDFYPNFVNPGPMGVTGEVMFCFSLTIKIFLMGSPLMVLLWMKVVKMLVKYVMEVKMEVVMEIGLLFPQQPFVPMA